MIRDILIDPHPSLATVCADAVHGPATTSLLEDMVETMQANGAQGLAAPQVGVLERAIVVRDMVSGVVYRVLNPTIRGRGGIYAREIEGCRSVNGVKSHVVRSWCVCVSGQTENGEPFVLDATGALARCFQHQVDHLNGVLIREAT